MAIHNLSAERIESLIQNDLGVVSDKKVSQEMQTQGMSVPNSSSESFLGMLEKSLHEVNQNQSESDRAIKELVAGRSKNIHETMLTIERADASLKLAMNVRNKILEAYREVMRMQV